MSSRNQTLALAGIFQAASLAGSAASMGTMEHDSLQASIGSLYQLDPKDIDAIYGGLSGLNLGLKTLVDAFSSNGDREVLKYAFGLLMLERKLDQRPDLQLLIRERIRQSSRQADYLGQTHATVMDQLGDLYLHTISTLKPRVVVRGKPLYLQQPRLVGSIRATLLAGVRSAVLWSQVGGSRLKLVFQRRGLVNSAARLLDEIQA